MQGKFCEAIRFSEVEDTQKDQQDLVEAFIRSRSDAVSNKYEVLRLSGCLAEINIYIYIYIYIHINMDTLALSAQNHTASGVSRLQQLLTREHVEENCTLVMITAAGAAERESKWRTLKMLKAATATDHQSRCLNSQNWIAHALSTKIHTASGMRGLEQSLTRRTVQ